MNLNDEIARLQAENQSLKKYYERAKIWIAEQKAQNQFHEKMQDIVAQQENFIAQMQALTDCDNRLRSAEQHLAEQRETFKIKRNEINDLITQIDEQKVILQTVCEQIAQNTEIQQNQLLEQETISENLRVQKNELAQIQIQIDEKNAQLQQLNENIALKQQEYQQIQQNIDEQNQLLNETSTQIIPETPSLPTETETQENSGEKAFRQPEKHKNAPSTPFSQWLAAFFLLSAEVKRPQFTPDGRPLYAYAVNDDEYDKLLNLFIQNPQTPTSNKPRYDEWCACFCLAVSEIYRREYSGGAWRWEFFEDKLHIKISPSQRNNIVQDGLKFWQRNVQKMNGGSSYLLGTLLREGGLPLLLLAEENNRFSKVIEHGIAHFQDSQNHFRELEEYLDAPLVNMSDIFKQNKKLFADTVRTLMYFAQKYPLNQHPNPAEFLNENEPEWQALFPFSLRDEYAQILINKWLGNAAQQNQDNEKQEFKIQHFVQNQIDGILRAELTLPEQYELHLPKYSGSSVLQWQLYEGNQDVKHINGAILAQWQHEREVLTFSFGKQKSHAFVRHHSQQPLSVRFFSNGLLIKEIFLPDTQFDPQSPCVFVESKRKNHDETQWQLWACADYIRVNADEYVLRLPECFTPENHAEMLLQNNGQNWYRVSGSLKAHHQNDVVFIEQHEHAQQKIGLRGAWLSQFHDADGLPIYRGFPILDTPSDLPCVRVKIGTEIHETPKPQIFGTFQAAFFAENGVCLLRKRMSVLPRDFECKIQAGSDNRPINIEFMGRNLQTDVLGNNVIIQKTSSQQFEIKPENPQSLPENLILSAGSQHDYAVKMRVPFAWYGATLRDEQHRCLPKNAVLSMNDLSGKYIDLSAKDVRVELQFNLFTKQGNHVNEVMLLDGKLPQQQIYLQSFKSLLQNMFSCYADQDCRIEIALKASHNNTAWLAFTIQKYVGEIVWSDESKTHFTVSANDSSLTSRQAMVNIMRLDAPDQHFRLPESAFLGNGNYHITPDEFGEGLWLIYPDEQSPIFFRPTFTSTHIRAEDETHFTLPENPNLNHAARAYHPRHAPDVFDKVLMDMEKDYHHEGWDYFHHLKQHYAHLPLSVFEAWQALVRRPTALALAVLRLNWDDLFCERIRSELAFVWEWLPEWAWRKAIDVYRPEFEKIQAIYQQHGLPVQDLADSIPLNIMFKNENLRNTIVNGKPEQMVNQAAVKYLIEDDYQNLRKRHLEDKWHDELNEQLANFVQNANPPVLDWTQFSKINYDQATLYLPIFTAYVKANRAKVGDLGVAHSELLYRFYQIYQFDTAWFNSVSVYVASLLIGENA